MELLALNQANVHAFTKMRYFRVVRQSSEVVMIAFVAAESGSALI